jgi:CubicO group peptidase (beta-lactamase class C family)
MSELRALPTLAPALPVHERVCTDEVADLDLIELLRAVLPPLLAAHAGPGLNLALGRRGRCIWEAGFGWADAHTRRPQTPDTVFHSGSMGKVYTATVIVQMAEEGLLALADPISRHLPFDVVNPLAPATTITVQQLLTHTAGFGPDGAGCSFEAEAGSAGLEAVVRHRLGIGMAAERSVFPAFARMWQHAPGERHSYSNVGMALLGLIIEHHHPGERYHQVVQRRVMNALGMASAQYPRTQHSDHVPATLWERASTGHLPLGDLWLPAPKVYIHAAPAGAFLATPADHLRLLLALQGGGSLEGRRILQPESVAQMLTPAIAGPMHLNGQPVAGEHQGLGWWIRDPGTRSEAFHHGGGHMFGWRTHGIAWRQLDAALVVAVNHWSPLAGFPELGLLQNLVRDWLLAERPRRRPVPVPAPAADAAWAWTLSYLRGLLVAEAHHGVLGLAPPLSREAITALANSACGHHWHRRAASLHPATAEDELAEWDANAFVEGYLDLAALEAPTPEAIRAFAQSPRMRISLDQARRGYADLGAVRGGALVSLAGLLEPAAR